VKRQQPVNKYQIQKETEVSNQSLHNAMKKLKEFRWVSVAYIKKFERTGLPSEHYVITDRGCLIAADLDPELKRLVKKRLGRRYSRVKKMTSKERRVFIEELLEPIKRMIISLKAPPNYRFQLRVRTSKEGRVRASYEEIDGDYVRKGQFIS